MNDKDFMKYNHVDFKAGYEKGRADMMKECVAIILLIGFLFWVLT